jgi:hypothetical protein
MFFHRPWSLGWAATRNTLVAAGTVVALIGCDAAKPVLTSPQPEAHASSTEFAASFTNNASHIGVDFVGDHIGDADSYATKLAAAQTMATAGVTVGRVTAYWWYLQQFEDTTFTSWEFTPFSETVSALQNAGVQPFITLNSVNNWSQWKSWNTADPYAVLPDSAHYWAMYKSYVRQMLQLFPTVTYWGIWNEPNDTAQVHPEAGWAYLQAYEAMVDTIAPIIRMAGRKVVAPDLGDLTTEPGEPAAAEWLSEFLQHDGGLVDVVSVHSYGGATSDGALAMMQQYSPIVTQYAPNAELWLTEAGYANGTPTDAQEAQTLFMSYSNVLGSKVAHWTKTFFWDAGIFQTGEMRGLVHDLGLSTQVPTPAYNCLRYLANDYDPLNPPSACPGPMSATIVGPSQVGGGASATWSASVSNGFGPYTYTWSGILSGSGSSITGAPASSGDLVLSVHDPVGNVSTTALAVTVCPAGHRGC